MKKYYPYVIVAAIVCLSGGIYWNSLYNKFVNMDDPDLIVQNKYIKALNVQNIQAIFTPGVAGGTYQPIRTLSYALDYRFWKLNPVGYHLTNILCHACSTLLIFFIAYALAEDKKQSPLEGGRGVYHLLPFVYACLASLLFAVHPVHVEAVTWLSGRRDVLSVALALLSFYCFLQFLKNSPPHPLSFADAKERGNPGLATSPSLLRREGGGGELKNTVFFYLLSLLLFAMGLLAKSSVVVLPFLLVLYDICFLPSRSRKWRRMWDYVPFFLVASGFTVVFMSVARASGVARTTYHGEGAYTTFLTMLRVFAEYIYMLFIPRNLSLTYGIRPVSSVWEPSLLIAAAVLGSIAVLTVLAWKKSKLAFFGICWFFISLLPVSNIIPIAIVKADRYLYLPSVGFCLVMAWIIGRGWTTLSRTVRWASPSKWRPSSLTSIGYWLMVAMVICSYTFLTIRRNRDWKDSETLWTATLETTPTSTIALNNLGLIYAQQGMYDKALALYEQLLDYAPNQDHIERVYGNMAEAYAGKQLFDQAIDYYQKSLEANPEYIGAYLGLAKVIMDLGQYENALNIYRTALELEPQNETIYNQLGNLYVVQGKYDDAIAHYQKAIALNQSYLAAYNGLGLSYAEKGDLDQARSVLQQALRIDPDATVIWNSLGSLYMSQGETEKAIAGFQESLQRDPDNVEVRNNLGVLFLQTERYEEALREFMASLELQPKNPRVLSNLGMAYTRVGLYTEAIQMYRWALQLDPALFRTHVLLGDVCVGTKDFACAIEAYQNALTLQNANQEVQKKLQIAKEQAGKP